MTDSSIKNILVVKLSSIGDVIMTTPILKHIKNKYPNAKISFLVETESYKVIENNPYIDEIIIIERTKWSKMFLRHPFKVIKEFISKIKYIKSKNFDISIDVQGLFRSVIFSFLSGIKLRVGRGRWFLMLHKYIPMYIKNGIQHAIENYFDVIKLLDIHVNDDDDKSTFINIDDSVLTKVHKYLENEQFYFTKQNDISTDSKLIVISPYTRWITKNIPLEKLVSIINYINNKYNAYIIITGTKSDSMNYNELIKHINDVSRIKGIFGTLNLIEIAGIIKLSHLVICGDSAPMHITNALNKPAIALFGPTDPLRTGPYKNINAEVLQNDNPCVPCLKRKCKFKRQYCMLDMDNSIIFDAIDRKLK